MKPSTRILLMQKRLLTPIFLGSKLALWLDAADSRAITLDGSTVSQWRDKSGNGYHMSQINKANQPTYTLNGLNGKPVLTFNGTSTFLNAPNAVLTGQNWTFFAVFTMESATQWNARLVSARRSVASGGNDTDYNDGASWVVLNRNATANAIQSEGVAGPVNVSLSRPYIVCVTRDSGASAIILDGGAPLTNTNILSDLNTTDGIRIGRSMNVAFEANENWAGIAGELGFAKNLSTYERQQLTGYFAHKWGLTANLANNHPFKFRPPYM